MPSPIAAILSADYRLDGKEEGIPVHDSLLHLSSNNASHIASLHRAVMILTESGDVRAYLSTDVEFGAMYESGVGKDSQADQKMLNDLQTEKLEILAELKLLGECVKAF